MRKHYFVFVLELKILDFLSEKIKAKSFGNKRDTILIFII